MLGEILPARFLGDAWVLPRLASLGELVPSVEVVVQAVAWLEVVECLAVGPLVVLGVPSVVAPEVLEELWVRGWVLVQVVGHKRVMPVLV